jgi:hypothetical protein
VKEVEFPSQVPSVRCTWIPFEPIPCKSLTAHETPNVKAVPDSYSLCTVVVLYLPDNTKQKKVCARSKERISEGISKSLKESHHQYQ